RLVRPADHRGDEDLADGGHEHEVLGVPLVGPPGLALHGPREFRPGPQPAGHLAADLPPRPGAFAAPLIHAKSPPTPAVTPAEVAAEEADGPAAFWGVSRPGPPLAVETVAGHDDLEPPFGVALLPDAAREPEGDRGGIGL